MATTMPRTARALLGLIRPSDPVAEGRELVLGADLPGDLIALLAVLHTGVRALVCGKKWFGCDGRTGRVEELTPDLPLPSWITLLTVESDTRWDRIDAAARLDHPRLFMTETV